MKKIITVLIAVLAMSSMFAYIPNKKNIEKYGEWITYGHKYKDIYGDKKTSYITYNTKTGEIYLNHYENFEALKKINSPSLQKALIKNIERMWEDVNRERESYRMFIEIAEYSKKYCKEYCKGECKKVPCCEDRAKESLSIAKEIEKQFLDKYPFFTEENWLTLTEEEWNKMAKDFLENN